MVITNDVRDSYQYMYVIAQSFVITLYYFWTTVIRCEVRGI